MPSDFLRFPLVVSVFGLLCLWGAAAQGANTDVVINEVMYHPPNDLDTLQYIEIFNRGPQPVDLSGWALTKGIKFPFPPKTALAAGAYLVVCRDVTAFSRAYGRNVPVLGNFTGKLGHSGERLELLDLEKKLVDAVKYSDQGDWPSAPDGHSPSLERISPFISGELSANWASSKMGSTERPLGTPGSVNDSFSSNLPPVIKGVTFSFPKASQPTTVTATAEDADGVNSVSLSYSTFGRGRRSAVEEIPMARASGSATGGVYQAAIGGVPEGTLVRFQIKAIDAKTIGRTFPSDNEPRPTLSYLVQANTNTAKVPMAFVQNLTPSERGAARPGRSRSDVPTRGQALFVYMPPGGGEVQAFDYVRTRPRKGGLKVYFQKDRMLHGISTANLIFEGAPRWVLAEPLAYELYRLAGVPAELTEHVRLTLDGRPVGYFLLIEQPNKSFLARNGRGNDGDLFKLLWYGDGITGQHEKKINVPTGHADLVKLITGLKAQSGEAQWTFIKDNFNVEEVINYYAVNMCIQNWDGFFNNYYTYHDPKTGKWEIYPWDEDKTWGDYDGASSSYDWYEMPLTMGMNGDRGGRGLFQFGGGMGFGGGWWRPPGFLSGPLLAKPKFRQQFLVRLREICTQVFTEEKMLPIINAMEERLEPEIRHRASLTGEDPQRALKSFHRDMQSFRNQVKHRREFILKEVSKAL